jgi:hypothetical protein
MRYFKALLMALLGLAVSYANPMQDERRKGPIIRQVDHILVESSDPTSLFSLFYNTLNLPEAWPLTENQGFVSGGVGTANASIRFFQYATQKNGVNRSIAEARYAGLALQPYPLTDALRELRICGIPYDDPEPYISTLPNGSRGTLWTTVSLPSFSRPGMTIFLYEYSKAFLRVEARRQQLGNRLALNGGGPLGVLSIREILIATRNLETDRAAWDQLLEKKVLTESRDFETGPLVRLSPGSIDGISEILITVHSLDRARRFLEAEGLLGAATAKKIYLNPSKVQDLKIGLIE